jgi:hypothetical protein
MGTESSSVTSNDCNRIFWEGPFSETLSIGPGRIKTRKNSILLFKREQWYSGLWLSTVDHVWVQFRGVECVCVCVYRVFNAAVPLSHNSCSVAPDQKTHTNHLPSCRYGAQLTYWSRRPKRIITSFTHGWACIWRLTTQSDLRWKTMWWDSVCARVWQRFKNEFPFIWNNIWKANLENKVEQMTEMPMPTSDQQCLGPWDVMRSAIGKTV